MARSGRLRLFRDGRFVDAPPDAVPSPPDQLPGVPWQPSGRGHVPDPAPLLADDSRAAKVVGYGCLAVVLLPLLLATLVLGLVAAAFAFSGDTRATTAVVTSIGPGQDAFGPRPWCYEVRYSAADGPRTHRTCDVLDAAVSGRDGAERERAEARFAASHPVGTQVQVLQDVDPPSYAEGAIADADGAPLTGGGLAGTLLAGAGALVTGGLSVAVLWLAIWGASRGRMRGRVGRTGTG